MLENASQSIACYFDASQGLKYIPSWVCSIAACGWALSRLVEVTKYTLLKGINYRGRPVHDVKHVFVIKDQR